MSDVAVRPSIGDLLREWRGRRRLTQLDLALEAGVSSRHLSFIETGRSRPSTEMVLRLAEQLDVPLRERNALLLAAGYAPAFAQRGLDEPEMGPVRDTLERILAGPRALPGARRRSPLGARGRQQRRCRCSPRAWPRSCSSRRSTCCA